MRAIKFDSRAIDELPAPRPMYEISVYSPRVEGVHLRFGKVARGGNRWTDRPQDFRTEILGLVKAQQVKNAVIVPVGAKGGFVPKRLPSGGTRDAVMEEGIAAYRLFIQSLLDITDNVDPSGVAPPKDVATSSSDEPRVPTSDSAERTPDPAPATHVTTSTSRAAVEANAPAAANEPTATVSDAGENQLLMALLDARESDHDARITDGENAVAILEKDGGTLTAQDREVTELAACVERPTDAQAQRLVAHGLFLRRRYARAAEVLVAMGDGTSEEAARQSLLREVLVAAGLPALANELGR